MYFNRTNTIRFIDKKPAKIEFPTEWELKEGTIYYIDSSSQVDNVEISKENIGEESCQNSLPTNTLAEQMLIFTQLIYMRERYREIEKLNNPKLGEIDWYNGSKKECVVLTNSTIEVTSRWETNSIFSFHLKETRDHFLENFGDMILQCKNILG